MLRNFIASLFFGLIVIGCGSSGGTFKDGSFDSNDGSSDSGVLETLSVSGVIIDSSTGNPVANANISSGDENVTSDENGSFLINVESSSGEVPLDIDANGFSSNQKLIKSVPNEGSYIEVNLKNSSLVNFDLVSIASSGKKGKDDGLATLSIVTVDGVTERELIPGDLKTTSGSLLEALGAFELILRDGNQVVVSPAPSGFEYTALIEAPKILQDEYRVKINKGDTLIPLWQYNETTGVWSQDDANKFGSVVEVGGVVFFSATVKSVGWFGFFNTIEKLSCVKGLVLDGADKGLAGVEVVAEGLDYQGFNSTRTDANGVFSLLMKSGSTIRVFYRFAGEKQQVKIIHLQDYAHDHGGVAANSFCQPTGPSNSADPLYVTYSDLANNAPPLPLTSFESENNSEFPLILKLQPVLVSGKVVDANGVGIANAKVQTDLGVGTNSDASGDYSINFFNLAVDSLKVKASILKSGFVVSDEKSVSIITGEATASVANLVLDSTSIIKYVGTITGPDKSPVSGATVTLDNGQSALTDLSGVYTIFEKNSLLTAGGTPGVNGILSSGISVRAILRDAAGAETLCLARSLTGAMVDVSTGQNIATIDLQICRSAVPVVAQVEGLVEDSTGAALGGVDVIPSIEGVLQLGKKTVSDSNGKYKFDVPAESGSKYTLGVLAKFTEFQQTVSTSKSTSVLFESDADSKAFVFDSQWNLLTEDAAKLGSLGKLEKWLLASNGFSFVILPDGSVRPSNDVDNVLFTLGTKFYGDVSLILNAIEPGTSNTDIVVTFADLVIERPAQPTLFTGIVKVNGVLRAGVKVKAVGLAAPEVTTDTVGAFSLSISPSETFVPNFFLGGSKLKTDLISSVSTGGTIDLGTVEATLDVPQPFIISSSVTNPNGKLSAKAIAGVGNSFTLQLVARGVFTAPTIVFTDTLVTQTASSTSGSEITNSYSFPAETAGFFELKYEIQESSSDKLTGSFFLSVLDSNKAPVISELTASALKIGQTETSGVTLAVKAFDPEGGSLTYQWAVASSSVNAGITMENSTSDTVTVKTAGTPVGDLILEVTVTDESLVATKKAITIKVIDLPPTILSFTASPSNTVAENQLVTIALESEDPNGGETKVASIAWGDGSPVEIKDQAALDLANGNKKTAKENFNYTHTFTKEGLYTVSVLVVGPGGKAVLVKKTISVLKSYEKPKLKDEFVIVDEDQSTTFDLLKLITNPTTGSDYIFRVSGRPVNGFVSITKNQLTYEPIPNHNGSDTLKLIVNDGFSDSAENVINITIKPVADAPVLQGSLIQAQVPFGSTWVYGADKVFDPDDNNTFTFLSTGFTGYGSIATGSTLVFSATGPAITQDATSTFKFKVSDGLLESNEIEVQITVIAPSADIVAADATFSTVQNTQGDFDLSLFVSGSADLSNVTIELLDPNFKGLTTISGKIITFNPPANQTGPFTSQYLIKKFTANGILSSNIANITVNVTAPPVLLAITSTPPLTVDRGASYSYTLQVNNAGGSTVAMGAEKKPNWLTFVGGVLNGIPTKANVGDHDVILVVNAGGITKKQLFTITVNLVNAAPVITAFADVSTNEEVSATVTVNFTDADVDDLNHVITVATTGSKISIGTVSGNVSGSTFTLTPALDYVGSETITVKVKDTQGDESIATFQLTVTGVDDAPVLSLPVSVAIQTSTSKGININFIDPDGTSGLTWTATSSNGLISIAPLTGNTSGDILTVTPNVGFTGTGSVNVMVTDGGLTDTKSILIEVGDVNDPPVITATPTLVGTEDTNTLISGQVSFADPDAGASVMKVTLQADHGAITLSSTASISFISGTGINDTSMTFTGNETQLNNTLSSFILNPESNYAGSVKVKVTVDDMGNIGLGGPNTVFKEINVNLINLNDPPSLTSIANVTMPQNGSQSVVINFSDPDIGDTVTWVATSSVGQITFAPSTGTTNNTTMIITAAPGYNGTSTVNVTVDDGSLTSGIGFLVMVTPDNQAPMISGAGLFNIFEDSYLDLAETINITDSDAGAGILKVQLSSPNGKLSLDGTSSVNFSVGDGSDDSTMHFTGTIADIQNTIIGLSYMPAPGFSGTDSINVFVDDQGNSGPGGAKTASTTATIVVTAVNDAPRANVAKHFRSVITGSTINIDDLSIFDEDALSGTLSVSLQVRHGLLSLSSTSGLTLITGNGSSSVNLEGNLNNLNNALASLSYQANGGFRGLDSITITIDDQGNTGGPAEQSTEAIIIRIANPIFVNTGVVGGTNDGSSWANAYSNLNTAITAAGTGSQLWVAQGLYQPGSLRTDSFLINKRLELLGGFVGTEKSEEGRKPTTNLTYLDGEQALQGDNTDNSYHVVTVTAGGAGSYISGFIIKNGFADGGGDEFKGAGVYVVNSAVTIEECTIRDNVAGITSNGGGGGVYSQFSDIELSHCYIVNNSSNERGGGLFIDNGSSQIENCVFANNSTVFGGGAAPEGGFPIAGGGEGGAIYNNSTSSLLTFTTFYGNSAFGLGGAFFNGSGSSSYNIDGCIFYNNGDEFDDTNNPTTPPVNNSLVQGGLSGTNIIDVNPGFFNTADLDGLDNVFGTDDDGLMLTATSKSNGLVDVTTLGREFLDILGNSRTFNPDMGAFEYYGGSLAPTIFVDHGANVGGDGSSWGSAFNSLQQALTVAGSGAVGREIWVKKGDYYPHEYNRSVSFLFPDKVSVFGGFNGDESLRYQRDVDMNRSKLSGNIGDNSEQDNSYHVVKFTNKGLIDGFTVEGGYADGNTGDDIGAGIYAFNPDVYIQGCHIFNNFASMYGGGVKISSGYIFETTFANCESGAFGGGVYAGGSEIEECVFVLCRSDTGGGLHSSGGPQRSITDNIFVSCIADNTSSSFDDGGAAYITSILFESNYMLNCSSDFGGGLSAKSSNVFRNIFSFCKANDPFGGDAIVFRNISDDNVYVDNMYIGITPGKEIDQLPQ